MHIELIGRSILVKSSDGLNVVLTINELIELTRWAIDHEVELRAKLLEAENKE